MKVYQQVTVLLFVVLLGFIGSAMPYPIFAPLFLHPEHGNLISPEWSVTTRNIFFGLTLAAYPFGQFIGSPILGSLSDQLGRKKLLLVSMLSACIFFILSGLSIHYGLIWLLILSRFVGGFLEGNLAIAQACIADLAIDKHKGFGALSAMTSLGYVFGPILGGVSSDNHLVSWFNYSLPFYIAGGLAMLASISIALWTKETLNPHHFQKKPITDQFNLSRRFTELSRNENIKWILMGGFFFTLAIDMYYIFFPVLLVKRWQMSSIEISTFTIVLSCALTIGCTWIPIFLSRKFTTYKNMCAMIIIFPIGFIFILMTQHPYFLYLQVVIIGLGYGAASTFHTVLLSDHTASHQQGEIMGVRGGLRTLGETLNCIFGSFLITLSTQLPIIAAIIFAALGLMLFYKKFGFSLNRQQAYERNSQCMPFKSS